jgi:hypothetical protein
MSIAKLLATVTIAKFSKDQVTEFVTGLIDGLVHDN